MATAVGCRHCAVRVQTILELPAGGSSPGCDDGLGQSQSEAPLQGPPLHFKDSCSTRWIPSEGKIDAARPETPSIDSSSPRGERPQIRRKYCDERAVVLGGTLATIDVRDASGVAGRPGRPCGHLDQRERRDAGVTGSHGARHGCTSTLGCAYDVAMQLVARLSTWTQDDGGYQWLSVSGSTGAGYILREHVSADSEAPTDIPFATLEAALKSGESYRIARKNWYAPAIPWKSAPDPLEAS